MQLLYTSGYHILASIKIITEESCLKYRFQGSNSQRLYFSKFQVDSWNLILNKHRVLLYLASERLRGIYAQFTPVCPYGKNISVRFQHGRKFEGRIHSTEHQCYSITFLKSHTSECSLHSVSICYCETDSVTQSALRGLTGRALTISALSYFQG